MSLHHVATVVTKAVDEANRTDELSLVEVVDHAGQAHPGSQAHRLTEEDLSVTVKRII